MSDDASAALSGGNKKHEAQGNFVTLGRGSMNGQPGTSGLPAPDSQHQSEFPTLAESAKGKQAKQAGNAEHKSCNEAGISAPPEEEQPSQSSIVLSGSDGGAEQQVVLDSQQTHDPSNSGSDKGLVPPSQEDPEFIPARGKNEKKRVANQSSEKQVKVRMTNRSTSADALGKRVARHHMPQSVGACDYSAVLPIKPSSNRFDSLRDESDEMESDCSQSIL